MSENKCPICSSNACIKNADKWFAKYIHCDNCGIFYIESSLYKSLSLKTCACIYLYLTNNKKENETYKLFPHFHQVDWEDGIFEDEIFISEKEILKLFPTTNIEKKKTILLNLANRFQRNAFITYYSEEDKYLYPLFLITEENCDDDLYDQLNDIINDLIGIGYLRHIRALGDDQNSYKLTDKAWDEIDNMNLQDNVSRQCFIAMWFDSDMEEAQKTIEQAITDCKYNPMIINRKEHNNLIVPEILNEINKSKFIIADLTGNRGGVYFEAGYAKGLGREVIFTCRSSDFNERHFDLAQVNTIKWNNEGELYASLVKRIKETIK